MTDFANHPVDLLPELALGVLLDHEAARVRDHLAGCPACTAEYDEMVRVATVLPLTMEEREPSPAVRDAVFDRIRTEPAALPASPPAKRAIPLWLGAAAAAVLVVGAAVGGYLLGSRGDDDESVVTQAQFQRYTELLRAVVRGDVARVEAESEGKNVIVVSAEGSQTAYAWVENFPELPEGKAYQLWTSRDGTSLEPGRVFTVDTGGFWFTTDQPFHDYVLLGFTIEDAEGADTPTQEPFFALEVGRTARVVTP